MRLAFCGASGTGKSTIVTAVAGRLALPICSVGSREVAKDMGFDNPYDVDAAGKRGEFQTRLLGAKIAWEEGHSRDGFVTDRTHLDNLAYTQMHSPETAENGPFRSLAIGAMARYTHLVFCPIDAFHDIARDPSRVDDIHYHHAYECRLTVLLARYVLDTPILWLTTGSRDLRVEQVLRFVRP